MSWNVFGDYAAKILSPEFISELTNFDIILLQETHLWPEEETCTPTPPGYNMFAVSRPHNTSWQRRGGGVIALVRKEIRASMATQMSSPDILVLNLDKCWVVGVYLLPENSRWEGWTDVDPEIKFWETLTLCLASAKPLFVLGDLNARTGSMAASETHLCRSSLDRVVNRRGRELLSAADDFDLTLLNGTSLEHMSPGGFTSYQPNGKAVVDYALVCTMSLASVNEFKIIQPCDNPCDAWSDHAPLVLTVDRTLVAVNERQAQKRKRNIDWPGHETEIDILWRLTMDSAENPEQARKTLYGRVLFKTLELQVYTDGSCINNGRMGAVAGSGVYWGQKSEHNRAERVPGPGPQTNNRGELYAVVLALLSADPRRSLLIVTDSELVIREACYWAPQHAQMGWDCPNGDLLRDMVRLLSERMAPTRFVWVKGHSGNERGDAADRLAKDGAMLPEVPDYTPIQSIPWVFDNCHEDLFPNTIKVSTTLPEVPIPKIKQEIVEPTDADQEGPMQGPAHRGREKTRALQCSMRETLLKCKGPGEFWKLVRTWTDPRRVEPQVSFEILTDELRTRMNAPVHMPASFNAEQLKLNALLAEALPSCGIDMTPDRLFSCPFCEEEIEWGKRHVKSHTIDSAKGADGYSYKDVMAIPNDKIAALFAECLETMKIPSRWLASLVIGIPKHKKDPTNPKNYRLIVLECCLLKFFTLLIDKRIREYTQRHGIVPETQNGFRTGYRTNNNPFILRTMADKAKANNQTLYVAYIDLKNAFPWTNRETLWLKLNTWGMSGPIISWLQKLYRSMSFLVRMDGHLSERFTCNLGLLTGDPDSPHLWNVFLADFEVGLYPGDMWLDGIQLSEMEQADDMALITVCAVAFQGKLNDLLRWTADNGCEVQWDKCVFSTLGARPRTRQDFYMGTHKLKEVRDFKYVGVHFQSGKDYIFAEQYKANAKKARKVANMCLGVQRIVGDLPVWEARTLYMARVDPYLIAGCEVVLDTVASQRESLERVQHYYIRRMLGLSGRSMRAVLFSETGLMPIRYRRLILALRYLLYLIDLPVERLAARAMRESYQLALSGRGSWFTEIRVLLANLPVPILWNLPANGFSRPSVEELIVAVERSANHWIDDAILSSDKTRDLLMNRLELDHDNNLVKMVLAFRHYLRVKTPKHRKALTHMVLSCHSLAMERLRWNERRRPPVPRELRLCRFCKNDLEDAVHALIVCPHEPIHILRDRFWVQVDLSLPGFRAGYHDPLLLLRALLAQRVTVSLLAKFAYDVLQVFYAEPIYLAQREPMPLIM